MELLWKILLLVLVLVLVSAEDQNQKVVRGKLGGDVTLTCSIRDKDIRWLMEIHNRLRATIGRTYSFEPEYSSSDFKTKYLIQENRFVIKTLTAEDFRRYFCAERKDGKSIFVDTFHLTSVVSSTPHEDLYNHTGTTDVIICKNEASFLSLLCLNIVLTLVVVGLTCAYLRRKNCRMKDEDVDLFPSGIMSECFYHNVQLPGRLSAD